MPDLLVTAFDPFGWEPVNASQRTLELLPDTIGPWTVHKQVLPTTFEGGTQLLLETVQRLHPQAVLCLGQAAGRTALTPERVAINLDDARIPDNAGMQPLEQPIVPGGPAAYFSSLPVAVLAKAIKAAGLPAEVSLTAGSFVCNHVLYALLHHIAVEGLPIRAAFLHLPLLEEQTRQLPQPLFGLPAEELARGVQAAIVAIPVE